MRKRCGLMRDRLVGPRDKNVHLCAPKGEKKDTTPKGEKTDITPRCC